MFVLALLLAAQGDGLELWPGTPEDLVVVGPRPSEEVREALRVAAPGLARCVRSGRPPAALGVSAIVLAAGFVDRVEATLAAGDGAGLDVACVVAALRALPFPDRGAEPPTFLATRVAAVAQGVEPPGVGPAALAGALVDLEDDLASCVGGAAPVVLVVRVAWTSMGSVGALELDGGRALSARSHACARAVVSQAHLRERARIDAAVSTVPLIVRAAPRHARRRAERSLLEAPTLFDGLGCGAALRGVGASPTSLDTDARPPAWAR